MRMRPYDTPTVRTVAGEELVERLGPVSAGSVNPDFGGFGHGSHDDDSGKSGSSGS